MRSKIKYKSKFQDEWHERVEFKDLLIKVSKDQSVALLLLPQKFSIGGQGIGQVFSHMKSLKHKQNVPPEQIVYHEVQKR